MLLAHYDPQLPIVVAAEAPNSGVGAVASNAFPDGPETPIAHASRTLMRAEKNPGEIEKQTLAISFDARRFHKLLNRRHFTLLTDHKQLLSIFGSHNDPQVQSANRFVQ